MVGSAGKAFSSPLASRAFGFEEEIDEDAEGTALPNACLRQLLTPPLPEVVFVEDNPAPRAIAAKADALLLVMTPLPLMPPLSLLLLLLMTKSLRSPAPSLAAAIGDGALASHFRSDELTPESSFRSADVAADSYLRFSDVAPFSRSDCWRFGRRTEIGFAGA